MSRARAASSASPPVASAAQAAGRSGDGTPHAGADTVADTPFDFTVDAVTLARALIGAELCLDGVGGVVIETEAYESDDPASHSHRGPTPRNAAMFGPGGRTYVYRSYGLHWCLNVVCGPAGHGAAVLVRALLPRHGVERMRQRRGGVADRLLCAGPGRLAQALGVTGVHDGLPLDRPPFRLRPRPAGADAPRLLAGPRIGITRAADRPWRFGLAGAAGLSHAFAPPPAHKPRDAGG